MKLMYSSRRAGEKLNCESMKVIGKLLMPCESMGLAGFMEELAA